ncbi:MAG: alpha/beta fold hydrolase [Chloroflexi bacterium]|nr:alpha/beta fold hydrolase [Chloroflexota bacterium]
MPYARIDDIEVHYEIRGRGTPLLLLSGMGASADMWGNDFLAALEARFRLILVDNRGAGATARGTAPYTIERLADDARAVLDKEGFLGVHVFGASMGGMVALALALAHPARVRGLVLGCTSPGGAAAVPPRRTALEDAARKGLLGISSLLVTPEFTARRTGLLTRLAVRAMTRPTPPQVMAEQLAAITMFDASHRLHEIVAPTQVITGDRDALMPAENSHILARGIRGARGVTVKDTGHCFFWEAPDRAAAAILDFLTQLAPAVRVPA